MITATPKRNKRNIIIYDITLSIYQNYFCTLNKQIIESLISVYEFPLYSINTHYYIQKVTNAKIPRFYWQMIELLADARLALGPFPLAKISYVSQSGNDYEICELQIQHFSQGHKEFIFDFDINFVKRITGPNYRPEMLINQYFKDKFHKTDRFRSTIFALQY